MQPRALLIESFRAAIAAADPQFIVPAHLPAPPAFGGRTLVIGAGKAAASMAARQPRDRRRASTETRRESMGRRGQRRAMDGDRCTIRRCVMASRGVAFSRRRM